MQKNIHLKLICSTLLIFFITAFNNVMASEPVSYVKNIGQWDDHILYKASVSGGYLFVEQNKITFVISESDKIHHVSEEHSIEILNQIVLGRFSYQVEFEGANLQSIAEGKQKQTPYHNYFTSPDPSKWRSEVPLYNEVLFTNFYPNIDLLLKSKDHLFEYDFIIHPGADVSQIKMKYNGIDVPTIRDGQLHLTTPMGKVVELAPIVFQNINGEKQQVKTQFVKNNDNTIGFKVNES